MYLVMTSIGMKNTRNQVSLVMCRRNGLQFLGNRRAEMGKQDKYLEKLLID